MRFVSCLFIDDDEEDENEDDDDDDKDELDAGWSKFVYERIEELLEWSLGLFTRLALLDAESSI